MHLTARVKRSSEPLACTVTAATLAVAVLAIFVLAPTEETMGVVQRIVYIHVSVAWFGLVGFILASGVGLVYLVTRNIGWDHWAQAAAEIGWLCATLTLITGSLWAHEAWNTWWTWDPRLTTSLILWTIYAGIFSVRAGIDDRHRRARIGAILALIGLLDVPLVIMATRWFRGMHPVSPEMEPAMYLVLGVSVVAFTLFFMYLIVMRRNQLVLVRQIDELCQRRPALSVI
jgi:heme exporter protein C